MKSLLLASFLVWAANAQDPQKIMLTQGVSVEMAVASHAIEMRAADELDATVVAITAAGKVYLGIKPTEPSALSNLSPTTIYVKADARVPYQKLLSVLDALRGKSVVLLTAVPETAARQKILPPYGVKLTLPQ